MNVKGISTKIVSTLGNKESLIPIMIKDGVDSASLTYKSFKEGGIIEGKDRAVDEFGTQAIWIGGIPFFKKIIDLTLYKHAKINPEVDPRIIANSEYAQWAKENAKGFMPNNKNQSVKSAIADSFKNNGKTLKNLYTAKIISATALTLSAYFILTKLKQKKTKDNIIKKLESVNQHNPQENSNVKNNIFSDMENFTKNVSFKGNFNKIAESVMFNPVHNMKIIDAGITTERLMCSRNKTEFFEHAIKEGGFLFFIYGFGNLIEKGINKFSDKILNKPIDLKIDVLTDDNLKKALSGNIIIKDSEKFKTSASTLTEKLNFFIENPKNILVQSAKKAGIIKTAKDSMGDEVIDTSKYIDMREIEKLKSDLINLSDKFNHSKETAEKFLFKTKALKILSVMANIGISCFVLGYIIPKAIYKYREYKTGTKKFHVEEEMKKA